MIKLQIKPNELCVKLRTLFFHPLIVYYCFMPLAIAAIVIKVNNLFQEKLIINLILINKIDKKN